MVWLSSLYLEILVLQAKTKRFKLETLQLGCLWRKILVKLLVRLGCFYLGLFGIRY